jgi:APA family basic amino acid/polyamine antiporter
MVFFGAGKMVGAGILVLIGVAAEAAGPAVCLSYVIAAAAAVCSALCYCEATAKVPIAGGAYSFAYVGIGELPAFTVGWMIIFTYACGAAALSRAWAGYTLAFISELRDFTPLARFSIPGWLTDIELGLGMNFNLLAVLYLGALLCLVCFGISQSSTVSTIVTTCKLVALTIVMCVAFGHADIKNWESTGFIPEGYPGVFSGAVTVFYAYVGFDAMVTMAEEVKNPRRNLPLGIILSIIIAVVMYVLISVSVTLMVPYTVLVNSSAPLATAFKEKGIGWMVILVAGCASLGIVAGTLLNLVSQPRIWMCLARDGLMPPQFAVIQSGSRTPLFATIFGGVLSLMLCGFVPFKVLTSCVSVGALLALTSVNISLIMLRHHEAGTTAPWAHIVTFCGAVCVSTLTFDIGCEFWFDPQFGYIWGLTTLTALTWLISTLIAVGIAAIVAYQLPIPGDSSTFVLPLAGGVCLTGVAVNLFMMLHIRVNVYVCAAWMTLGLIIYTGYGFWHAELVRGPAKASEQTSLLAQKAV